MSTVLILSLAALAIIDSTSIGTLFIPVWLLLAPDRIRAPRFLAYLGTIAGFYLVVGILLAAGGTRMADAFTGSRPVLMAQLAVGIILFVLSFWVERRKAQTAAAIARWRTRATDSASVAGLALLAALAEVATMLPYLGAIGMLSTADLPWWSMVATLAGYCVVMVVPAMALFALRVAGASWLEPLLGRLNAWALRSGGGMLSWILGIAGFLIARDAAARLWFPQLLGS
jgi:Sap-like sulfolipid-1-addressing protein